jgi:hypothetical protein
LTYASLTRCQEPERIPRRGHDAAARPGTGGQRPGDGSVSGRRRVIEWRGAHSRGFAFRPRPGLQVMEALGVSLSMAWQLTRRLMFRRCRGEIFPALTIRSQNRCRASLHGRQRLARATRQCSGTSDGSRRAHYQSSFPSGVVCRGMRGGAWSWSAAPRYPRCRGVGLWVCQGCAYLRRLNPEFNSLPQFFLVA